MYIQKTKFFKKKLLFLFTFLMLILISGALVTSAETILDENTETIVPEVVVEEIVSEEDVSSEEGTQVELQQSEVLEEPITEIPSPLLEILDAEPENATPAAFMIMESPVVDNLGSIIIILNAVPNSAQNFSFTNNFENGNPSNFQLDDDSNETLLDTRVFPVLSGTYRVNQAIVSGWKFISATCSDGSSIDAITVDSGEQVTCTFTNKKRGSITLIKNTTGGDGIFDFSLTGVSLPSSAQLTTVDGTARITFTDVDPENNYSITEITQEGWELTNASCTRGTPGSFDLIATNLNITCTFENLSTNLPGEIRLIKETIPDGAYDEFFFDGAVENPLKDGDSPFTREVLPGTYTTTEEQIPGWTTSSIVCDDSDSHGDTETGMITYEVSSGEVVTCIITNVKNPSIEIDGSGTLIVGEAHTLSLILGQNTKDVFTPVPDGTQARIAITPTGYILEEDTCATIGTQDGICTVTLHSDLAGVFTAHGEAQIDLGGITYELSTDGVDENTGDAQVTYLDARIRIEPVLATQNIGQTQVAAVVYESSGDAFVPTEGELVTFSIVASTTDTTFKDGLNTCITDADGTCSVTITTSNPGTAVFHAESLVDIGGYGISRATDGSHGSSFDGERTFMAGKIIVKKVVVGNDLDFAFTTNYNEAGFVLGNSDTHDSGYLPLGSYNVYETIPEGWYQVSANCDNGDTPDNITLSTNGEIVNCTFVNAQIPITPTFAQLTIVKDAQPNNRENFTFLLREETLTTRFVLDDDAFVHKASDVYERSKVFTELTPGAVTVTELLKHKKWRLTDVSCTRDTDNSVVAVQHQKNGITLELEAGEAVTCVFTNIKRNHEEERHYESKKG